MKNIKQFATENAKTLTAAYRVVKAGLVPGARRGSGWVVPDDASWPDLRPGRPLKRFKRGSKAQSKAKNAVSGVEGV